MSVGAQGASALPGQADPAGGFARRDGSWPGQAGPARSSGFGRPHRVASYAVAGASGDAGDDRLEVDRLTLVTDLRHAIAAGTLDVFFQPKVTVRDGRTIGVEALLRWDHPDRGRIPPGVFVPVAEHTGLIGPLTDLVLERALRQARVWVDSGHCLTVAVNISGRTIRDKAFPEHLRSLLARVGVSPEILVLEIAESVLLVEPERTVHMLDRLSAMGVGLSIDDLGTGNSSLALLRRLPADEMKVDHSFIRQITSSTDEAAVVGTIIQLGHRLGKRVVAEGVEDEASWDVLRRLGCDLAQGYWICRPDPAALITTWLGGARGARDHAVRGDPAHN